jgi:predicted acetyltransferase
VASVGVTIELVPPEQKAVLRRLLQLYLYDFTEFEDQPLGDDGEYRYAYFEEYWAPAPGEERYPYFIRGEGKLAGFAMVRVLNGSNVMSEFFVLRPYRRGGIGGAAAKAVFRAHPGPWIVHEHPKNLAAQAFWPRVIGELTGGNFEETREPDGALTQRFTI